MSVFRGRYQTRPRSRDTTSRAKVCLAVKRGDTVVVLAGDDKGKRGKVIRTIPHKRQVVVQNVNQVWKHLRRTQQNPQGGRVQREAPLAICKVMVVDPATNEPTKVYRRRSDSAGLKIEGGIRFSNSTDTPIADPS